MLLRTPKNMSLIYTQYLQKLGYHEVVAHIPHQINHLPILFINIEKDVPLCAFVLFENGIKHTFAVPIKVCRGGFVGFGRQGVHYIAKQFFGVPDSRFLKPEITLSVKDFHEFAEVGPDFRQEQHPHSMSLAYIARISDLIPFNNSSFVTARSRSVSNTCRCVEGTKVSVLPL